MQSTNHTILRAIYRLQPTTRRQLGEQMGLSAGRISALVSELVARGLVGEETSQDGSPGRPAAILRVSPTCGTLVGLDIGGKESRAVLTDLGGNLLSSVAVPTEATPDRAAILDNIVGLVEMACKETGVSPEKLAALGVGLQGFVDTRTGVVLGWPNTPGWAASWTGLDVAPELHSRLGTPLLVVDDSVRAMAVAAHRLACARGCVSFLYVYLGDGIGSALLLDGQPYRSSTGLAGELGHISILENGPSCTCGNRGCLEMLASTPALLKRVQERLAESSVVSPLRDAYQRNDLSIDILIAAARKGDKLAFQVLDEAGTHVGRAVAIALNLMGPELVVLGGPLARDGGIICEAVRRQVRLRALEHISRQARIICDDQGEFAGAHGAALLALDAVFTSPGYLESLVG